MLSSLKDESKLFIEIVDSRLLKETVDDVVTEDSVAEGMVK